MMMALEPKVFMFDEPTAGMSVDEVPVVLDLIAQLEDRQDEDDPARRAQDGRGALARRPHHRLAQRPARRGRRSGEVIASPIVQEAYLGIAPEKAA